MLLIFFLSFTAFLVNLACRILVHALPPTTTVKISTFIYYCWVGWLSWIELVGTPIKMCACYLNNLVVLCRCRVLYYFPCVMRISYYKFYFFLVFSCENAIWTLDTYFTEENEKGHFREYKLYLSMYYMNE